MRPETWQQCNLSRPKDNLGSCLRGPPRWESVLQAPEHSVPKGKVTALTGCQMGVRHGSGREPSFPDGRARRKGVGRATRECEDGRPTHPHCRTVCHCSRPSCRRHARRLPGHCIAGAHRLRAPPEESPPDGTVSCAYPTLGGRCPAGSGPCTRVEGGAPSPPGTPDGSGWGRG